MLKFTKKTFNKTAKKVVCFFLNPRLILCVFIGWMITNGWSYLAVGLGTFFKIKWLIAIGGAYISFLWFPFTPEKIITIVLAIKFLKILFPNDEKTLAVLIDLKQKYISKKAKNSDAIKGQTE